MNARSESTDGTLTPAAMLALLAAAPHRLLFFAGAGGVLLSMAWWAAWLIGTRWPALALPQPPVPAGWAHAVGMQYQVLGLFIFGFLLTVFPRWMGQPAFGPRHYVPVAGAIFAGYLLTLASLFGFPVVLHAGVVLTLLGWVTGCLLLLRVLWRDGGTQYHALSIWAALALGGMGLAMFARYLHSGDARLAFGAIKIGTFGFLLPVYATVAHRMVPFFAQSAMPGHAMYRPGWILAMFWVLLLAHLMGELAHAYAWLWPVDLALALLSGYWWLRWQPLRTRGIRLLWVLHLAFAWLPIAFALYALQGAIYATTGAFELGRAPVHALTVGFFGSMLVAMVTRVTQGHSGRPLEMGAVAWTCFLGVQAVSVLRIAAELLPDSPAWMALAAVGWLLAFLPWVLRSLGIYLNPARGRKARVIEFHPQVKWLHVGAVILSGALFAARGLLMLASSPRANHALLRHVSYAIDTVLLGAALALAAMLHQYPFVHGWLTVKVLLLAAYIVLGSFALKRGRSYGVRAACLVAALAVYATIIAVARAHHPLGPLARWFGH